jgi:hypothetical protein
MWPYLAPFNFPNVLIVGITSSWGYSALILRMESLGGYAELLRSCELLRILWTPTVTDSVNSGPVMRQ